MLDRNVSIVVSARKKKVFLRGPDPKSGLNFSKNRTGSGDQTEITLVFPKCDGCDGFRKRAQKNKSIYDNT